MLAAAEVSIRDYWSTGLPEVYGKPFHDLAGGFQPKSPSSRPWKCHGQNLTYDNIKAMPSTAAARVTTTSPTTRRSSRC